VTTAFLFFIFTPLTNPVLHWRQSHHRTLPQHLKPVTALHLINETSKIRTVAVMLGNNQNLVHSKSNKQLVCRHMAATPGDVPSYI
jgi:hypothetical protein